MLKLGYYGLTTQAECYSIKRRKCNGGRRFAPEVEKGEYETKSDVWSLAIALVIMMGITPRVRCANRAHSRRRDYYELEFDEHANVPEEAVDFLQKCIQKKNDRWSVSELMNVSVME